MIKDVQTIKDVLAARYAYTRGDEDWFYCPFHDDDEPSMHVNWEKGIWYCFSMECRSRFEGKWTLRGLRDALREFGYLPHEDYRHMDVVSERMLSSLSDLVEFWHKQLMNDDNLVKYLISYRAISPEIMSASMLGLAYLKSSKSPDIQVPVLTIPIFNEDMQPVAVKARMLKKRTSDNGIAWEFSTTPPRYFFLKSKHHPLIPENDVPDIYPLHMFIAKPSWSIWIVGGELDALAAWSHGICALASTKGETHFTKEIYKYIQGRHVIICLDNEPSTQRSVPLLAEFLGEQAFAVSLVPPSAFGQHKDFTDVAVARQVDQLKNAVTPYTHSGNVEGSHIFVDDIGYYVMDNDRKRYIFLGHIHPIAALLEVDAYYTISPTQSFLTDTDSTPILFEVEYHNRRRTILTSASLFSSAGNFRKLMMGWLAANVVGSIKNDEVRFLFQQLKFPFKATTNCIGLHLFPEGPVYIFPNWSYPETHVCHMNIIGDPTLNDDIHPIGDDMFIEICKKLLKLHYPQVILKLFSMMHAVALATFVRAKTYGAFPCVLVYGMRGSGKTTLVSRVILRLMGLQGGVFVAPQQTESTLRKYAYLRLTVPLVLDEFTPRRYSQEVLQNAKTLIHRCYDRAIAQVSKDAMLLAKGFPSNAPLWIIGEEAEWLSKDGALVERVYTIPLPQLPTHEHIEIWSELRELQKHFSGYAERLYRFLIDNKDKWDDWWDKAERLTFSVADKHNCHYTYRLMLMWCVATFGFIVWNEFWKQYNIYLTKTDEEKQIEQLDTIILKLSPLAHEIPTHDPFITMLIELNDMKHSDDMFPDDVVKLISNDGTPYLIINPHKIHHYLLTVGKLQKYQHITAENIRAWAKQLKDSGQGRFIEDCNKPAKFKGKTARTILVNLKRLYEDTGILLDAFWGGGYVSGGEKED